jgi:hypothetical protein
VAQVVHMAIVMVPYDINKGYICVIDLAPQLDWMFIFMYSCFVVSNLFYIQTKYFTKARIG